MADRIEHFVDVDALSRGAAVQVADWLKTAIAQSGEASLVLAGGSTPKKLHAALVSQAGSDGVDWSKVTILFGDERAVGPDHDDSNFNMAAATLIEPMPVKPKAVHRMKGELGHVEAAAPVRVAAGPRVSIQRPCRVSEVATGAAAVGKHPKAKDKSETQRRRTPRQRGAWPS